MKKSIAERIADAQSVPVYASCHYCLGEIYLGQNYYEMAEGALCMDCLPRYARQYFLSNLRTAMTEAYQEETQEARDVV